MPYILDIATAVPDHAISNKQVIDFYSRFLDQNNASSLREKLPLIVENSKITNRYSCIPDFTGEGADLFDSPEYNPRVEDRLSLYAEHVLPLSIKAIDSLLVKTLFLPSDITHIITVSCTGVMAPGLEFLISEYYNLQHAEKSAINFLGCYAALKALTQANHITKSEPGACVLIVCTELCSLHFNASTRMEDVIANLIFADGAAAMLVCGDKSPHIQNKVVLHIDSMGSAYIPGTLEHMTWSVTSSAFRMYLSRNIATAIKDTILSATSRFLVEKRPHIDHWAIHPGGIRIIQAVQHGLLLSDKEVEDSLSILQEYGNMSSPTILFILKKIFDRIKESPASGNETIFSCAFGPGLNIEMMQLSAVDTSTPINKILYHSNVVHSQI